MLSDPDNAASHSSFRESAIEFAKSRDPVLVVHGCDLLKWIVTAYTPFTNSGEKPRFRDVLEDCGALGTVQVLLSALTAAPSGVAVSCAQAFQAAPWAARRKGWAQGKEAGRSSADAGSACTQLACMCPPGTRT